VPRGCTVCAHEDAVLINEALVVQRRSKRTIAAQFGLSATAIQRHKEHIPQLLLQASRAQEVADADLLLDGIANIREKTFVALDDAKASKDWNTMLRAIREARENVRILGELHGQLAAQGATTNYYFIAPGVVETIVEALRPYPEAGYAVSDALKELENRESDVK
jgi:hypothetical protein